MTKPISRKMAVDCLLHRGLVLCGICGCQLMPGDNIEFDHYHALVFGGPHTCYNLRPVHHECHKKKTAKDIKANAKVKRIKAGGKKRRGRKLPSKPFPKTKRKFNNG